MINRNKNLASEIDPHIIFDLDGTLSNPLEGILNSFRYAFSCLNESIQVDERISEIVGPPLHAIFTDVFGFDEKRTESGVRYFREYYGEKGVFENILYEGIFELLQRLKREGIQLYIATSKYEKYAYRVLEYHGILEFFTGVEGASYRGTGADKSVLVRNTIRKINPSDTLQDGLLMIGDTKYDMAAARQCSIPAVGVLYGFGSEQELRQAGADYITATVNELREFIVKRFNL